MRPTISNRDLIAFFAVAVAVFFPTFFVAKTDVFFEILNLTALAVAVGLAVGSHPAALNAIRIRSRQVSPARILIFGVVVGELAIGVMFAHFYAYRVTDDIYWLNNWSSALCRWLYIVASAVVLLAIGADQDQLPISTYKRAGIWVAVAILAAGILFSFGVG